jgi:hypothetical protein
MYMCVYIYVCICMQIYIFMYIHIHAYIYIYIYIHIYIYTNTYLCTHIISIRAEGYDPRVKPLTPLTPSFPGELAPDNQLIKIPNQLVNLSKDLILFDKVPQHCVVHRMVCICIHVYTCIYMYIYICIYIYLYVFVCVWLCI